MSRDDDRDDRDDHEYDRPRRDDRGYDRPLAADEVRRKVRPPAIALLVAALLSLLTMGYGVYDYVFNFDKNIEAEKAKIDNNPTMPAAQKAEAKRMFDDIMGPMRVVIPIQWGLALLFIVLISVGATKMMSARSLGWSRTAAILAMIPCYGCWLLGIPFGIWAMVVLSNPQLKEAFDTTPRHEGDEYDRRDDRDDYDRDR
jgi:hypothetical protein